MPWQAPVPPQVTVFMLPSAVTPPLHELLPKQFTLQGLPPHWTAPTQAPSAQRTVQLVESRQSIEPGQPDAGQSMAQAIPIGHLMSPAHGLHADPHAKVQTSLMQLPPAATQS